VLVAGSYLGTLSHTLTAVACLKARGLGPAAVVISESLQQPVTLEETADAVRQRLRDMPIIALPRASAAREGIATLARLIVGACGSGFSRDSSKSRD
jgi:dethiobiotin synthetase